MMKYDSKIRWKDFFSFDYESMVFLNTASSVQSSNINQISTKESSPLNRIQKWSKSVFCAGDRKEVQGASIIIDMVRRMKGKGSEKWLDRLTRHVHWLPSTFASSPTLLIRFSCSSSVQFNLGNQWISTARSLMHELAKSFLLQTKEVNGWVNG